MRIVQDIQSQIYELGNDGRLVKMQLEELIGGVEKEENSRNSNGRIIRSTI